MKKIYVIGLGPGAYEELTIRADRALQDAEVVVGYTVYVDLVKAYYPDKEFLTTTMTREVDRCRMAFEQASQGKKVAMVCSGDAGVYGMAGLMYELSAEFPEVELDILPGITAALGGSAVLGAVLGHDFAVISLSDLLTPWEIIAERVKDAGKGDFCICFYNPSSKKRHDYLQKACDILLQYKKPETICGCVRNIAREGEECQILTLAKLRNTQVDMFTTVFIGNSQTKVINGKIVTPRGYQI
ncbi:precorrin-3B C(17)-methyltransferase [[Clostridium] polysaccharolyticum]|uniref:Precorrin-3B C17-methyltransferase n=1 Tax=[Clostridium] polysaccharolyticum TaxID=29364 RepID=A0A1H9Y5R3_9FIRM|nr:precorrin-3B C(17)-methyltransferase [[Clostridium] polysaccharolyticum]SES63727.1 precorrin-3B C17-methyltransferase [[Clostridium] polysaccharolyticum]